MHFRLALKLSTLELDDLKRTVRTLWQQKIRLLEPSAKCKSLNEDRSPILSSAKM